MAAVNRDHSEPTVWGSGRAQKNTAGGFIHPAGRVVGPPSPGCRYLVAPILTGIPGEVGYGSIASPGAGTGTAGGRIMSDGFGMCNSFCCPPGNVPPGIGYGGEPPGTNGTESSGGQGIGWPVAASKHPLFPPEEPRPTVWHAGSDRARESKPGRSLHE